MKKMIYTYVPESDDLIEARRKDAADYLEFLAESARESLRKWGRDVFSRLYDAKQDEAA